MGIAKSFRIAAHRVLIGWGVDTRRKRADRILLERVIFPELLRSPEYHRILFIGCAWYTLHYPSLFGTKDFSTLEIDPAAARFGAAHHVIGSCEMLDRVFARGSMDCILFNGVFGFGLNSRKAVERTWEAMHAVMRPGGLLVFGWNDLPEHCPFPVDQIDGLRRFEPWAFPPLGSSRVASDPANGHQFWFLRNRGPASSDPQPSARPS